MDASNSIHLWYHFLIGVLDVAASDDLDHNSKVYKEKGAKEMRKNP